jgi:hypothetical protein
MQPFGATPSDPPSDTDIRQALDRAVGSAVFRAAPKLTAFLRFVVERALAGEAARLKGYTIAVEALGRDADFDPGTDPSVRVEAGRLRQRLERYYGREGAADPVIIEIARGSYVPRFRRRPPSRAALAPGDEAALHALIAKVIEQRRVRVEAMMDQIQRTKEMLERSRTLLRRRT